MYEGFLLWLIVLGSPGFPSVSCPRHALNLLGLMWLKSVFGGKGTMNDWFMQEKTKVLRDIERFYLSRKTNKVRS